MNEIPIELAGAVLTNSDAELWLLHRRSTGRWELPGGKVEVKSHESAAEAAVREVSEELEVHIVLEGGHRLVSFRQESYEYDYHWYGARIDDERSPRVGEPEIHDKVGHFPRPQLIKMRNADVLSPNVENLVAAIISDKVKLLPYTCIIASD